MISIKYNFMPYLRLTWGKRTAREKNLLLVSGILIIGFLWFYILISPAIIGIENSKENIKNSRIALDEINRLAEIIPNASKAPNDPKLFTDYLESTMIDRGFVEATISNTENLYHVEIGLCSFQNLVSWLLELKKLESLMVTNAIITRKEDPKFVKVSLTLQQVQYIQ